MLREDIRGTNRIVIKTEEGYKFIFTKALVNNDEVILMVTFPEGFSIPIVDREDDNKVLCYIDNEHFLNILGSICILKDHVVLSVQSNSNIAIEDGLYNEEDSDPDDIVSVITTYVDEPEEESKIYRVIYNISHPMEVIADPKLMIQLLNDGTIVAEEDVLAEYGLLPSWKVYGKEGKVRTKRYVDVAALRGSKQ